MENTVEDDMGTGTMLMGMADMITEDDMDTTIMDTDIIKIS